MKRLDTMVPPPIRTKYEIRIMLLAVFLAGFLAWRDEHHARLEVETAKSNVPVQSERVSRDPDGIYQYGNLVGKVELPFVDQSNSTVTFSKITGAVSLDIEKDFDYRDYILRMTQHGAMTNADVSGQKSRAIWNVVCSIVKGR
jgi:hypothetical protein